MPGNQGSLGELFTRSTTQISRLFRAEIALTKAQAKAAAQCLAATGILLVTALVLTLYMLGWLAHAIFLSWRLAVPFWIATLLAVAVSAVLTVILNVAGYAALKKVQRHLPNSTEGMKADVGTIKPAFKPATEEDRWLKRNRA